MTITPSPRLAAAGVTELQNGGSDTFIQGLGRCIGPLVKLHKATAAQGPLAGGGGGGGHGPALDLAMLLARKATREFFLADGSYDHRRFGPARSHCCCVPHIHSITESPL